MAVRAFFLELAERIGRRVVQRAIWQGERCTWEIPNRAGGELQGLRPAPATLYEGTAGIALFLLELYRATGSERFRAPAQGAVLQALDQDRRGNPDELGFFTGRVGVAYAAARAAVVFDEERYLRNAEQILREVSGRERRDPGLDVIGGAAGAIPALLEMRDLVDPDLATAVAERFGEHLIQAARFEPVGCSWRTVPGVVVRNLTGFGHGAAGIGHALLELHAATRMGRYRYGAEQAFLYEQQFFDRERGNWPDFRDRKLSHSLRDEIPVDERRAPRRKKPSPSRPRFVWAWCHGAPGIGLSRLRAFEILGEPGHLAAARASVESTLRILRGDPPDDFSLCHGAGGHCETVLQAAATFREPELRAQVEEVALEGAETGKLSRVIPHPGLMVGEAGVGHFLLRLAVDAPPVLLIRGAGSARAAPPDDSFEEVRERHIDAYFGRTRLILRQIGPSIAPPRHSAAVEEHERDAAPVRTAFRTISTRIRECSVPVYREWLQDVFSLDATRYRLSLRLTNTAGVRARGRRAQAAEDPGPARLVRLAPDTSLVRTRWDWDRANLVAAEPGTDPGLRVPEPAGGVAYIVWQQRGGLRVRRIGALAAAVLDAARAPASLADITRAVRDGIEPSGHDAEIEMLVRRQVAEGLRIGLLVSSGCRGRSSSYRAGADRIGSADSSGRSGQAGEGR